MRKAQQHDHQGALDDYTATIDLTDTPAGIRAMTLYNRSLVYSARGERTKAIDDLQTVLSMASARSKVKSEARRRLARMQQRLD